jgi:hypothetical protein
MPPVGRYGQFGKCRGQEDDIRADGHALRSVPITNGTAGEGDLVQLAGYVTIARDEGAESVNWGYSRL